MESLLNEFTPCEIMNTVKRSLAVCFALLLAPAFGVFDAGCGSGKLAAIPDAAFDASFDVSLDAPPLMHLPDGSKILSDGAVELPDGHVIQPDAAVILPDGAVRQTDGAITS